MESLCLMGRLSQIRAKKGPSFSPINYKLVSPKVTSCSFPHYPRKISSSSAINSWTGSSTWKFGSHRLYSTSTENGTERAAKVQTPEYQLYLSVKGSLGREFRSFMKEIHPDRFHQFPEIKGANEYSLKTLNELFDAIDNWFTKEQKDSIPFFDQLPSPTTFKFVFRHGEDLRVLKSTIHIPLDLFHPPHETGRKMVTFYKSCITQLNKDVKEAKQLAKQKAKLQGNQKSKKN